jgi:hypothetical protein
MAKNGLGYILGAFVTKSSGQPFVEKSAWSAVPLPGAPLFIMIFIIFL